MVKYNKYSVTLDYVTYESLKHAALCLLDILDKPEQGSVLCLSNEHHTCIALSDVYPLSLIISDYKKLLEDESKSFK